MQFVRRSLRWSGLVVISAAPVPIAAATMPPTKVISRIDLSKAFHLPPGASLTASQAAPVDDPVSLGESAPGIIHLCLRVTPAANCSPNLDDLLKSKGAYEWFSHARYLERDEIVFPRGASAPPLLHLQLSSAHSGDGDQVRAAAMLAYRGRTGRFETIYREQIGNNHNEEVRYIHSGPLKGSIVVALSPYGPPFSYVIKVSRLTPEYRYKQVLRYRSATIYGDGNPLAVIDSEMPNILGRLGLWRPGQPLPLPNSGCARPRLVKSELWCS